MKLSIITVNLNNLSGLERTFESVFQQTFQDHEFIVIDGDSTDGSKEAIIQNKDRIDYYLSEKDNGVYAAMNKGILRAKGDYLLFLNSGDSLLTNRTLDAVFTYGHREDILFGNIKDNVTGNIITFPEELRFSFFKEATINHQASFIKRRLFEDHGLYNEKYRIAADWEFFIRCIFLNRVSTRHLGFAITEFDFSDGVSTRKENYMQMLQERSKVLYTYFPGFMEDYEDAERLRKALFLRNEESLRINKSVIKLARKIRRIVKR
jgi:glycosyltransferase involved in cell wall biosynthesis